MRLATEQQKVCQILHNLTSKICADLAKVFSFYSNKIILCKNTYTSQKKVNKIFSKENCRKVKIGKKRRTGKFSNIIFAQSHTRFSV